jgi:hypothetical protein
MLSLKNCVQLVCMESTVEVAAVHGCAWAAAVVVARLLCMGCTWGAGGMGAPRMAAWGSSSCWTWVHRRCGYKF